MRKFEWKEKKNKLYQLDYVLYERFIVWKTFLNFYKLRAYISL